MRLHTACFADAVPDGAADGAIDFLAFFCGQAQHIENDFIQFGAVRQPSKPSVSA
ncbi:MAG: hypothetical protein QUS13_09190 [Smithella sp.]|nr:hypothetical protein [Smithella sp.]